MGEVRSSAEVVNVVRTRTLSAMGESQPGATLCYENAAKSDNERYERKHDQGIQSEGSFMVLNVCSGESIQIGIGLPAR